MRPTAIVLLAAFACLAAEGREAAPVSVHEWGVLVYGEDDESGMVLGQSSPDPEPAAVRAPVVYFHGPAFSGTFTVALPGGDFTTTYPTPDTTECNFAQWRVEGSWSREREAARDDALRSHPDFGADWSAVESMMLSTGTGGSSRYLFYECTLSPDMLEPSNWLAPVQYDGEEILLPPLLSIPEAPDPELLVLTLGGDGPLMWRGDGSQLAEAGLTGLDWQAYSRTGVVRTLMDWDNGSLAPDEIDVMWDTWEPWALRREDPEGYVIFTELWPQKVAGISRISLQTDGGQPVEYSRFFLGALVISGDVPVRHVSPDEGEDLR